MADLTVDGMAVGPGVVETIVSIAANEVEGVASVGGTGTGGLFSVFGAKPSTHGVEVFADDNDRIDVTVRVDVHSGYVIPDVADELRRNISDAVSSQIGLTVSRVDVFVDGIQFVD